MTIQIQIPDIPDIRHRSQKCGMICVRIWIGRNWTSLELLSTHKSNITLFKFNFSNPCTLVFIASWSSLGYLGYRAQYYQAIQNLNVVANNLLQVEYENELCPLVVLRKKNRTETNKCHFSLYSYHVSAPEKKRPDSGVCGFNIIN